MKTSAPLAVVLVMNFAAAMVTGDVTIARNGQASAVIVVGASAGETDRHAAAELSEFLRQATGGEFPIAAQADAGKVNLIVGAEAARAVDPSFTVDGLGTDGIVIKTMGNNLILAGGKPRGTLYAVYTFLEDHLGCRWWTFQVSNIPRRPTLSVGDLDVRYVPQFELREILLMPYTRDADWSVRNKCVGELHGYGNDGTFAKLPERGGALKAWPCGHSYYIVLPPEKYFADHPEWYSLIEGRRVALPSDHASLCLTNEQMLAQFIENTRIEARRGQTLWPTGTKYISVSPPDDSGYPSRCQCEKCVAVENQEQSAAGPVLRFANHVAAAIEDEFPDKFVSFYAYHYVQKPPLHERPRRNVVVYFNPINASYSVPLTHPRNARWHDDLIGWSKICDRLYVYEYPTNVTYELLPHPNLRALWPNIRLYADHGVRGFYAEGNYGNREPGGVGGQELAELRTWVMAKLLWDPSLDPQQLVREFCDGYYGAAGPHIVEYLDAMHDAVEAAGDWLDIGGDQITASLSPDARFLSLETLAQAWAHLDAAEQAVRDDPPNLGRVLTAQLPARLVFLCRWNELRDTASNRGVKFPFDESFGEFQSRFTQIVQTNDVMVSAATRTLLQKARERAETAP